MHTSKCRTFLNLTMFFAVIWLISSLIRDQQQCDSENRISSRNYYYESKKFPKMVANHHRKVYDGNKQQYQYGPDIPLIFIGGVPRSGTTLMRVMLDAHPDIR